jgi:hypothetical protein
MVVCCSVAYKEYSLFHNIQIEKRISDYREETQTKHHLCIIALQFRFVDKKQKQKNSVPDLVLFKRRDRAHNRNLNL